MRVWLWIVIVVILSVNTLSIRLNHLPKALSMSSTKKSVDMGTLQSLSVRGGATKYKRSSLVSYVRSFWEKIRGFLGKSKLLRFDSQFLTIYTEPIRKTETKSSSTGKDSSVARIQKVR